MRDTDSRNEKLTATRYLSFSLADAQSGRGSITKAAWKRQPFRQLPSPLIQSAQVPEQPPQTDFNPSADDPRTLTTQDLNEWQTSEPYTALIWHPIVYRRSESIRHGMQTHQWAPDFVTPISTTIYLDSEGKLIAHGRPRFSRECLEPSGHGAITLGSVDHADAFYETHPFPEWEIPGAEAAEPTERWSLTEVARYAEALFNKVCETDPRHPIPGVRYERMNYGVVLPINQTDAATRSLLSTYDALETLEPETPLYDRLINPITKLQNDRPSVAERLSPLACRWGTLQAQRKLSSDQIRALLAATSLKDGQLQAINGPPGTGKTALLQDIIATEIVKAALRDQPAPLIVVASTNNQAITNALESMELSDDENHSSGTAWLNEATRNLNRRWIPWPSLGLYEASFNAQESARSKGHLIGEDMARFETTADLTKLCMTFIRHTRMVTGESDIASMEDATKAISRRLKAEAGQQLFVQALTKRLSKCDSKKALMQWAASCERSIDAWSELGFGVNAEDRYRVSDCCEAARNIGEQLGEREEAAQRLQRIQKEIGSIREDDGLLRLLKKWRGKAWAKPVWNMRVKALSSKHGVDLDELTVEAASLKSEMKRLRHEALTDLKMLIAQKVRSGLAPALEAHLQKHARLRWFWLALHLREGQWLQAMTVRGQQSRDKRSEEGAKGTLRRHSLIAPVTICTLHRLPKVLSYWDAGKQAELPLFNEIDLLILDEAGQCAPDVAAPAFALSRKAVVMGDIEQLKPVWSIESREDTGNRIASGLITRNEVISIKNDRIGRTGISTSEGNILSLAQKVSAFESQTDQARGLWLTEHRRCVPEIFEFCNRLSYEGRVRSLRSTDSESPLAGINYLDIPGADERKNGSRINTLEAAVIASWVDENRATIEQAYRKPIGELLAIITPFKAQAQEIERALDERCGVGHDILTGTVHATQGAQYPLILLSLTYSAEPAGRRLFWDETPSMLNVAVSRAMDSLIVAGDLDVLSRGGRPSELLSRHCFEYGERLGWPVLSGPEAKGFEAPETIKRIRETYGKDALVKNVSEDQPSALKMALTDESVGTVVILADSLDKKAVQELGNDSIKAVNRGAEVLWILSARFLLASEDEAVFNSAIEKLRARGVGVRIADSIYSNAIILPDQNLAFRGDSSWLRIPGPRQAIVIQSQSAQQWERIVNIYNVRSSREPQSLSA